ncbi:hypothetical protein SASPL_109929 [Salvia splendens]|uniref:Uncharacterized protein n=1 Tax=Salvia splendens TaxID=180675 RepID=A0A8X9A2U9_SALSN|nr:hypothetical protein SASPL_109929 [Salvia splendens]
MEKHKQQIRGSEKARKKKMPSPQELVTHYEKQGMATQEASLKVIGDLQGALFRMISANNKRDDSNSSPQVISAKLDAVHARLVQLETKLDSKPSYPQALALGVASASLWNRALELWNTVGDRKQLSATVLSNVDSKYMFQCSMIERLHGQNGDKMIGRAASFHETRWLGAICIFDIIDGLELREVVVAFLLSYDTLPLKAELVCEGILQALRDETMNDPRERIEIGQRHAIYRPSLLMN